MCVAETKQKVRNLCVVVPRKSTQNTTTGHEMELLGIGQYNVHHVRISFRYLHWQLFTIEIY